MNVRNVFWSVCFCCVEFDSNVQFFLLTEVTRSVQYCRLSVYEELLMAFLLQLVSLLLFKIILVESEHLSAMDTSNEMEVHSSSHSHSGTENFSVATESTELTNAEMTTVSNYWMTSKPRAAAHTLVDGVDHGIVYDVLEFNSDGTRVLYSGEPCDPLIRYGFRCNCKQGLLCMPRGRKRSASSQNDVATGERGSRPDFVCGDRYSWLVRDVWLVGRMMCRPLSIQHCSNQVSHHKDCQRRKSSLTRRQWRRCRKRSQRKRRRCRRRFCSKSKDHFFDKVLRLSLSCFPS